MFLGYGLVFITQYGASLIAASVLLLITSWQLALITFVLLPPIAIVATRYSRRSHPVLRDVQQRIADVTTQAEESIVGVRVVKAFAQEDAEGARFAERTERVFERELDSARIQARYSPLLDLLPQLAFAVIILARRAARDRRAALARRLLLLQPLPRDADLAAAHDRHVDRPVPARRSPPASASSRCSTRRSDITDPPQPLELPAGGGELRFEGVTFGYDADRPVLRDLDLAVAPGSTIARDRPHGLGQDDAHVARSRASTTRRRAASCSTASTCATCGSTTCAAASRPSARTRSCSRRPWPGTSPTARPGATREDVVEAARRAQAHEFIEALPEGLRHDHRRARADALGRPAPAALDRARAARRPARADPRRRDGVGRRHHGGAHPARAADGDGGPHDDHHRPPPLDDRARRRDRGARGRPRRRARPPRASSSTRTPVYAEIWRHGLVDRTFVSLDEDCAGGGALVSVRMRPDRRARARGRRSSRGSARSAASAACFTLVRPYRGKAILSAVTLHRRHRDRPRSRRSPPSSRSTAASCRATAHALVALDASRSWSPRCSAGRASVAQTYLSAWVGQRVLADLRRDLFAHIQTLELGYFERNRAGWLISRLTNDVDALEELVTDGLYSSVQNTLLLFGTAGVLLYLDWRLALATLTRLPAHGARDDALPHLLGARLPPHARAARRRDRDARRGPRGRARRAGVPARARQRRGLRRDQRQLPRGELRAPSS